jgi:hypothetical protein
VKSKCKRGHPLTEDNAHWHKRADGRRYYTCKACHRILQRLRYRNDTAFMLAERKRSRENYYRRQEQHA